MTSAIKTVLLALALVSAPAFANPVEQPHVTARLVSEFGAYNPGETLALGLHLKIEDGWKVYWRNPGDSGEPVRLNWKLAEGIQPGEMKWPAPERFETPPLQNYGYHGEVLIPVDLRVLSAPDGELTPFTVSATWLVCKEVCIPGKAEISLHLPIGSEGKLAPTEWKTLFDAARATLPVPTPWKVTIQEKKDKVMLSASGVNEIVSEAHFLPYNGSLIDHAATQAFIPEARGFRLEVTKSESFDAKTAFPAKGVLMASVGGRIIPMEIEADTESPWGLIWQSLVFAFLGGMFLNLMPCVFPVLFLKVFQFLELGGKTRRGALLHSGSYSLGILFSFWAIAGALIALRAGGEQLGWGFQLQSPIFVTLICFLITGLALNLLGAFEIGGSLMGVGGKLAGKEGLTGSFFSGVLATIVATPCTAPFMGSAVGYALTLPLFAALLIFSSLALGMAFPYVLLSSFPQILERLPKPGQWMIALKQFLAFPLLGTVVWMLWVLGLQSGTTALITTLSALLCFSLGLWLYGQRTRVTWIRNLASLAVVAGALWWAIVGVGNGKPPTQAASGELWKEFTEPAFAQALASGKPVFVDFTAAWCITCQVNKEVVFENPAIDKMLRNSDLILFRADWTNPDETITRQLESYGRNGVPLYVLYRKNHGGKPEILPAILTTDYFADIIESL